MVCISGSIYYFICHAYSCDGYFDNNALSPFFLELHLTIIEDRIRVLIFIKFSLKIRYYIGSTV